MHQSLRQVSEEVDRAGAAVPLERSLGWGLGELFREKWLASLLGFVRERMCADEVCVLDGDVRVVFVKSRSKNRRFCSSLHD